MQQRSLAVIEDAPGAVHVPRSAILSAVSTSLGAASPARQSRWSARPPAPEEQTNPYVLPILLSISLGIHVVIVGLSVFLPERADAATVAPNEMALNIEVQPIPEPVALPEPEPEPEVVPEPTPVARRRAVTQPEPQPAPSEPPPPAPVMVAEGAGASSDWAHHPGEEGGQLGGVPGGTGTGQAAPPVQSEAVQPRRRGLSRQELRRRVLAYIRGTLSNFVNGRLDYPLEARRNHLEGVVVLRLRLDEDGALVSVRLSRTSGHQLLDRAALARVQGLRRMPAPPDSIPWDSGLEIPLPVTYRLQ